MKKTVNEYVEKFGSELEVILKFPKWLWIIMFVGAEILVIYYFTKDIDFSTVTAQNQVDIATQLNGIEAQLFYLYILLLIFIQAVSFGVVMVGTFIVTLIRTSIQIYRLRG